MKNYNDAMKAIISIVLNNGKRAYDEAVRLGIQKQHFVKDKYRVVWEAFDWLAGDGSSMNKTTVSKCLSVQDKLPYLSDCGKHDDELLDMVAFGKKNTINDIYTFARLMLDEYVLTKNYEMAAELQNAKTSGQQRKILEKYADIWYSGDIDRPKTMTEIIDKFILDAEQSHGKLVDSMRTKLPVLSKYLLMTPGNQTVIAGDTGHGKSSLALQLVEDIASQTVEKIDNETGRVMLDENFNELMRHRVIVFFALEMSENEVMLKIYCARNNISYDEIDLLPKNKLIEYAKKARDYASVFMPNLIIVDEPDVNLLCVQKHCARIKLEKGYLDAVVIDHIGLMEEIYLDSVNETRQYKYVSRYMKMKIAKKLNTHSILVSQLNKAFTDSKGVTHHIPTVDRLFGSSGIKQDATNVIFVYREKSIKKDKTTIARIVGGQKTNIDISTSYMSRLIIDKSRFGGLISPTPVGFIPYIQRFVPLKLIDSFGLLHADDDKTFRLTDEQLEEVLQY